MTMTYTCTLTCGTCKALLTFTDERPAWKTYDYRIEHADACERSARFVAEYADAPLPMPGMLWPEYEAAGCPPFCSRYDREAYPWGGPERLTLAIPDSYRYVDCPVCDGHVREPERA